MTKKRTLRGEVAIAGIGETTYYKRAQAPDPEFKMGLEAVLLAAEDAGIDVREIEPPKTADAVLEVVVRETGIRVRFDQRIDWEPEDLLAETDWLPDGRPAIGMTGVGHRVVFRDLSIQRLP